jgi:non-heme chloroperoxidase
MHASHASEPERKDTSPHKVRMVSVAPDVQLETLDWGGSGRPIVFLAGPGNSAHIFDDLTAGSRAAITFTA